MNAEKYRLTNHTHSEVAPSLPLPNLPLCFGAHNNDVSLADNPEAIPLDASSQIAQLLRATDITYLSLREESRTENTSNLCEAGSLLSIVLHHYPEAFNCTISEVSVKEHGWRNLSDKRSHRIPYGGIQSQSISRGVSSNLFEGTSLVCDMQASSSIGKSRIKRRDPNVDLSEREASEIINYQGDSIGILCELLDDYLQKTDIHDNQEWDEDNSGLHLGDLKHLTNEITAAHSKNVLHLVPVETLSRFLSLLDHQIHQAHEIANDEDDDVDSDNFSAIMASLEAVHITLIIMTHKHMPKQVYNEEIIDRIINFSRNQILQNIFAAYDPSYRSIYKSKTEDSYKENDNEEADDDHGMPKKVRRKSKISSSKRQSFLKVSSTVSILVQKICTILGLLKELLLVERLLDSTVLLLIKISLATLTIDNIQLLQLKAIGIICAVFNSYSQHRTIIMDELFQLLWKLPSAKRNLRCYHLPDVDQKQIQMITALIVQIVQCSVALPEIGDIPSALPEVGNGVSSSNKCFEAAEICMRFWKTVLQRWANVKSHDGSEVKGVVENIVVDLLLILNVPEYPAAGLLLQVLCVLLFGEVGLKSKDSVVRGMAIDLLGQIASRLKYDAVVLKNDNLWILRVLNVDNKSDTVEQQKHYCIVCLETKGSKFIIQCDECKNIFHGDCIGVSSQDMMGRDWLCQCCLCRRQLSIVLENTINSSEPKNSNIESTHSSVNPVEITGVDILQQLLLNYLQESGINDDTTKYASRFYLWQWYIEDPNASILLPYYHRRLKLGAMLQDFGVAAVHLSRNTISKISNALGQQWKLARGFDKILEILLASLKENAPTPRAKALRAVSSIVEVDPEVLGDKRVQSAVEGRFLDSAISVREAAMELVGRHIASHPDVAIQYFDKVAERIMDTGVSVRKRVIKIIRDMCMSKYEFKEVNNACVRMISRINDEESSIQDLVCRTFYELWFEDSSDAPAYISNEESSVPEKVAERTEQLVDILRNLQNHQPLVTIIKRSLNLDFCPQNPRSSGLSMASQSAVRNRCELMCLYLLERVLQTEERDNNESDVRTLPYVLALHAFCTVDPTICAPQADPSRFVSTLQPYLKNQHDNRDVAQLLQSIVFVIDAVLPLVRRPPPNFVEELERDLRQMILRHSFLTVVHACIKCLCCLKRILSHDVSSFDHLVRRFFKQLEIYKKGFQPKDKQIVLRGLFCLGLLVRYGANMMSLQNKRDVSIAEIISLFKHYLRSDEFTIKIRSLQALGFAFIARPEFMMEKDVGKIIEATISPSADPNIKMQTLRNLYEYLVENEEQMGKNDSKICNKNIKQPNGGAVPVAAGAGDNNFCGGIIQLHWNNILERCLDTNDQVRQSALKVVEIVLRQGLVHPITCVPYLIALEVDQHEMNAKLAHRLLMHMNEKYPSFFESRLGDGLQLSFRFIQSGALSEQIPSSKSLGSTKCKQDVSVSAASKVGISRIYKLIKGSRISRNKFLSSIVRKFDFASWSYSPLPFLVYCAEVLAALPFTVPDEPLYVVYAINRIVQVRAGSLESEMKSLFTDTSFRAFVNTNNENGFPETNMQDQREHDLGFVENTNMASVNVDILSTPVSYLQRIKAGCHAAIAIGLLLKLKRHLKLMYSLNDARCQAFSPTEPIKAGETLSKQGIQFSIRDTPITVPTSADLILQQYQEFKRLLKEDTVDYSLYTANVPKRRSRLAGLQTYIAKEAQTNGCVAPRTGRGKATSSVPSNDYEGFDDSENEEEYTYDQDWTGQAYKHRRISSGRGRGKKFL